MGFGIHPGNHPAGGFFKRGGDESMDQRTKPGGKQLEAELAGKGHMLKIGFIHTAGMLEENFVDHGLNPSVRD